MQQSIDEAARLLAPAVRQINEALREQPVVHFDESSMRVGRMPCWLHLASTRTLSWYGAHRKRGSEALDSFGILPGFKGVAVHDGWRPYAAYGATCAVQRSSSARTGVRRGVDANNPGPSR